MSAVVSAVRVGVVRGWIEFRQLLASPQSFAFDVVIAAVLLVVLYFQRDTHVAGAALPLATLALPGVVGMLVAFNTLTGSAFAVAFEREDGTLLRAKAAPYGVVGYLTGQTVRGPLFTLLTMLMILIPGLLLFQSLANTGIGGWLTFVWVLVLGLLATLPVGLALGAVADNPRAVSGYLFIVSAGLIAISGIFYPITALPGWLQWIGQVFPFYWLGLGMRSALLPDAAAAVEIGESWRHWETAAVLGAWAVVGLVLAPVLLRRMARRVSGTSVEAGRQKAAQRMG